jgi:hypothetical protein
VFICVHLWLKFFFTESLRLKRFFRSSRI